MIPAFDIFGLCVIALAVRKGIKRGPARELYRLIRVTVALAAGCGLYGLTRGLLSDLLPVASGLTGFLIYFGGAFALVHLLKRILIRKLDQRLQGRTADLTAMLAGGLRGLILLLSLIITAHLAPLFPWKGAITEDSWLGRVPGWFLPEIQEPSDTP